MIPPRYAAKSPILFIPYNFVSVFSTPECEPCNCSPRGFQFRGSFGKKNYALPQISTAHCGSLWIGPRDSSPAPRHGPASHLRRLQYACEYVRAGIDGLHIKLSLEGSGTAESPKADFQEISREQSVRRLGPQSVFRSPIHCFNQFSRWARQFADRNVAAGRRVGARCGSLSSGADDKAQRREVDDAGGVGRPDSDCRERRLRLADLS
jgi:hypothetical protein